ncbi:DUF2242 domain-containing protein [Bordetella sp. FB-8]|uniref:DUF2242 domain-containing protein n=1 Tax=Bordetella sp. FB-8 TaxID=1159870 RepID=UPI00037E648B|nr:DUF2242 domain-containing protein [Bordetella sp. FB-8]
MFRVSVSLASLAFLLTACGSSPNNAAYEQENFIQNQTYSRSVKASYRVACDAGRRALLSQGYSIDKSTGDTVSGHKNFVDSEGRNTQITFNVNCAPDSSGPNDSQVFANAIQDSFSLKKSTTAASVGVSILGSVSLPFMSSDDALVKTSSVTVTRPQFYSGFFDLLHQYLAVAQLEQPQAPSKKPAVPAQPPAPITPTVPLTPENTGIPTPAPAPKVQTQAPTPVPKDEPAPAAPASAPSPASAAPASSAAAATDTSAAPSTDGTAATSTK